MILIMIIITSRRPPSAARTRPPAPRSGAGTPARAAGRPVLLTVLHVHALFTVLLWCGHLLCVSGLCWFVLVCSVVLYDSVILVLVYVSLFVSVCCSRLLLLFVFRRPGGRSGRRGPRPRCRPAGSTWRPCKHITNTNHHRLVLTTYTSTNL